MRSDRKTFVFLLIFCLCLSGFLPLEAAAENRGTLSARYAYSGTVFENLELDLYKIAELDADGRAIICAEFNGSGAELNSISDSAELAAAAKLFEKHIAQANIRPIQTRSTDKTGQISFDDLTDGVYMIEGAVIQRDSKRYRFDPIICLLGSDEESRSIDASPKCEKTTAVVPEKSFSVTKRWIDNGYASSRPTSVTVDIFCNSTLYRTVMLSADNDWTFTWKSIDENAVFTVTEKYVPSGYTVSYSERDGAFTVINTSYKNSRIYPKTGDESNISLWMLLLSFSGVLALVTAFVLGRQNKKLPLCAEERGKDEDKNENE